MTIFKPSSGYIVIVIIVTIGTISTPANSIPRPPPHDLVVANPDTFGDREGVAPTDSKSKLPAPEVYAFRVQSDITFRYSRTFVTSKVVNKAAVAQEVTFSVILPETAFISKFIMEIEGKAYEAYVKEKEEAKKIYDEAQRHGQSAGLVEKSTRNANMFTVNVNVKAQAKVTFNLTYEELLSRRLASYEQAINVIPDQISSIKDYQIEVNIEEAANLAFVKVPDLSNELVKSDSPLSKNVLIERPAGNKANIFWTPSPEDQKKLEKTGKFVVQYDVQRPSKGGQVLVMEGYFVHFFSPENLPPLRKHVVFILDISGSMSGRRIEQLRESQKKILSDLSPDDFFNIITFSTDVHLWSPSQPKEEWKSKAGVFGRTFPSERDVENNPPQGSLKPFPANSENIKKAKEFIETLQAGGSTNIHDAIIQGLNIISANKKGETLPPSVQSLILFLTDGEPTVGITDPTEIQKRVQNENRRLGSVPIFSLGFGEGADFPFLKKLSLQNTGFARKIYEDSDAALQLQGFYNEIASPLLSNVNFNYTSGGSYKVADVTVTRFPTLFGGTEIAVAGKLEGLPEEKGEVVAHDESESRSKVMPACILRPPRTPYFDVSVQGNGRSGEVRMMAPEFLTRPWGCWRPWPPWPPIPHPTPTPKPVVERSSEDKFLERLWAYLTIQQLIEQDLAGENKAESPKEKALKLALKYGFVTPLTSLVVVKPESNDVANAESADTASRPDGSGSGFGGAPGARPMMMKASNHMSFAGSSRLAGGADADMGGKVHRKSSKPSASYDMAAENDDEVGMPMPPPPPNVYTTSKPKQILTTTTVSPSLKLTLKDLTWLQADQISIRVNETEFKIARNETSGDNSGQACTIKPDGGQGRCRHLRLCVLLPFMKNQEILIKSYFCPIRTMSPSDAFVGVCCPAPDGQQILGHLG